MFGKFPRGGVREADWVTVEGKRIFFAAVRQQCAIEVKEQKLKTAILNTMF